MPRRTGNRRPGWIKRALSMFLAIVLLLGTVPGVTLPAFAAHWADEYLDQLVDWGVMRSDQIGDPDTPLTRAEFMAIINRAYGYNKTGPMPFTDVLTTDWFYDDISIAYNAGYMAGTSTTTADPNGSLTREMAACILARNMMMKDTPAESLAFTDSREVSDWARGLVKTAVDHYVISGYPDNSFAPQQAVTKGEMAVLITRCVGNPLNQPGEYELGDVFDNVTITTSGVTLRNTTVSGDLYVSAGVGLGNVKLENVRVLGRIIVSGTGESEKGDASVVMRNVTADEMLVDNMRDQLVTLRAEGLTQIGQTIVRTPAYLEDNTPDENGLRLITLEGGAGAKLDLAGRIKEVVSQAPRAAIKVAKGTVQKLTVDENSTGSTVQLDRNTEVKELNTDVATSVTGDGDVDKMNINSSGVTSTVLPDDIYIRPGLEANVDGENMDSAAAEESSKDPKILSGYPIASDVAPTSLRADFAANKRGTIYWAVSSITDGSVSADHLISPPAYGSAAEKTGSVSTPSADTVVNAPITGLTKGGSYYLSAVLVDNRGVRSPVKVISFTTPDDSKPAFAQGYPYMSLVTDTLAQVTVMPTKSCKLYYAVLPAGAQAPTINDMRSAAVVGNLGYGVVDVVKNTERTFTVSRQLEELKDYVLYLWLSDADGVNSSNITSLRFKTVDTTPPLFDPDPYMSADPTATSVPLTAGLNEQGTIYWVVVPQGARYPLPNGEIGSDDNTTNASGESVAKLDSEYAKQQVKNGRNALKRGSVAVRNADTDVAINITGLARGTAYDLYYVAQDLAGNFSKAVKMISIHTLDDIPPTVRQSFNPHGGDSVREPLTTSTMSIIFSEDVVSSVGAGNEKSLLTIRTELGNPSTKDEAEAALADFLEKSIWLYQSESGAEPKRVTPWDGKGDAPQTPWINYHKARFGSSTKAGEVVIEFPYNEIPGDSAHRLASGATYYFEIRAITDSSASFNSIKDGNGENTSVLNWENMGKTHNIPAFTTVFAQVTLSNPAIGSDRPLFNGRSQADKNPYTDPDGKEFANMDMTFRMVPGSTEAVDETNSYDMALFTNTNLAFDLYCRITTPDNTRLSTAGDAKTAGITTKNNGNADANGWFYIGNSGDLIRPGTDEKNWRGASLGEIEGLADFPMVSDLKQNYIYDFTITVTSINSETERAVWTSEVIFDIYVLAGSPRNLKSLAGNLTLDNMKAQTDVSLALGGLESIGRNPTAGTKFVEVKWTFRDTRSPKFMEGYPTITAYADNAEVKVQLDREGYIYYAIAPYNGIGVGISGKDLGGLDLWNVLPQKGQNKNENGELVEHYQIDTGEEITLSRPTTGAIMDEDTYPNYKPEPLPKVYPGGYEEIKINLSKLDPRQQYIIYFVLKGESAETSKVFGYAFETTDTSKPKFDLTSDAGSGTANVATQIPTKFWWRVFSTSDAQAMDVLKDEIDVSSYTGKTGDKMTVLEAMSTSYRFNDDQGSPAKGTAADTDFSLFDMYGSNTQKDAVHELIRNYTGGQTVNAGPSSGDTTVGSGTRFTHGLTDKDLSELEPFPSVYVLLVVGHHTGSDETRPSHDIDSFRAITDLQKSDLSVPYLNGFSSTPAIEITTGSETGYYKATLTLDFSRELYWVPSGGTAADVVPVIQYHHGSAYNDEGYIGIDGNRPPIGTIEAKPSAPSPGTAKAQKTYYIEATIPPETNVRLLANGSIANVNGITNGRDADVLHIYVMPANTLINKASGIENGSPQFVAFWNGELVSDTWRMKTP